MVGLIFGAAVSDLAAVGEEDELAESVEGFAFVELASDSAAVCLVFEAVEQEPGLRCPSEFLDCLGELV